MDELAGQVASRCRLFHDPVLGSAIGSVSFQKDGALTVQARQQRECSDGAVT